ncbi:hypothetical protein ASG14_07335 [Pedobacter sp. Leaf194]|nr:hypothetical protein ASG14_07335 [Pedobacter sp. Leaf194]
MACKTDRVRKFASGNFVNHSRGQLSLADDTLSISSQEGNNFKVHRRTGFNLMNNGKPGRRQFAEEHWLLVYDQPTCAMTELRHGRTLIFYPDSGALLIGRRKYVKQD